MTNKYLKPGRPKIINEEKNNEFFKKKLLDVRISKKIMIPIDIYCIKNNTTRTSFLSELMRKEMQNIRDKLKDNK